MMTDRKKEEEEEDWLTLVPLFSAWHSRIRDGGSKCTQSVTNIILLPKKACENLGVPEGLCAGSDSPQSFRSWTASFFGFHLVFGHHPSRRVAAGAATCGMRRWGRDAVRSVETAG
jgi:hypothetical protein